MVDVADAARERGTKKDANEAGGNGGGMWSVTIWRTTLNAVLLVQVTDFNVTQMRLKLLCVLNALDNENSFLSSDRNKNQQNRHSLGGKTPHLSTVCLLHVSANLDNYQGSSAYWKKTCVKYNTEYI